MSPKEIWIAFPSPRDLPDPGMKPRSLTLQADSLPSEPPGKPIRAIWLFCMWNMKQPIKHLGVAIKQATPARGVCLLPHGTRPKESFVSGSGSSMQNAELNTWQNMSTQDLVTEVYLALAKKNKFSSKRSLVEWLRNCWQHWQRLNCWNKKAFSFVFRGVATWPPVTVTCWMDDTKEGKRRKNLMWVILS